MDVNACLEELRSLASIDEPDENDAMLMSEHFRALDKWVSWGGVLPKAWREPNKDREIEEIADLLKPVS